jgi:hypothetical protein
MVKADCILLLLVTTCALCGLSKLHLLCFVHTQTSAASCCVTCTHFLPPQVQRVQYPELLPLCSLDALCIATLSAASMAHFDSGGLLDTSLDLAPLRELLGHGLVRGLTHLFCAHADAAEAYAPVPALRRFYCRERLAQAGMDAIALWLLVDAVQQHCCRASRVVLAAPCMFVGHGLVSAATHPCCAGSVRVQRSMHPCPCRERLPSRHGCCIIVAAHKSILRNTLAWSDVLCMQQYACTWSSLWAPHTVRVPPLLLPDAADAHATCAPVAAMRCRLRWVLLLCVCRLHWRQPCTPPS